jgi:hypothetical protein
MTRAYGEALVREIRAEMGRHEIHSVRALAEVSGIDRGRLNDRMKRKGKRVAFEPGELLLLAGVFGLEPGTLVTRAADAIGWRPPPREPRPSRDVG